MSSREHGSGSILVVAIVAAMFCLVALLLPLATVLDAKHVVATAADASALAAADVASGLAPGSPCAAASSVAAANRVAVGRCTVDGDVVTVTTSTVVLGFRVDMTATAGPPDS